MERNFDINLVCAVEKAVKNFGIEILRERRFLGILKDYGGFREFPPAEYITKVALEYSTDAFFRIYGLIQNRESDKLEEYLMRMVHQFEENYAFNSEGLMILFNSFLAGMGCDGVCLRPRKRGNCVIECAPTELTSESDISESIEGLGIDIFRLDDILHKNDHDEFCQFLYNKLGGYNFCSTWNTLHRCDESRFVAPYANRLKVLFEISSDSSTYKTKWIKIRLCEKKSLTYSLIRAEIYRTLNFLDKSYPVTLSTDRLNIEAFTNEFLRVELLMCFTDNVCAHTTLRSYYLKHYWIGCKLISDDDGFSIVIDIILKDSIPQLPCIRLKDMEDEYWGQFDCPKPF